MLAGALLVNGVTRFVTSGLSAALPHVVPREQVVTMNAVATAVGAVATFIGANFMLLPRWLFGANDTGSATVIFIVVVPVLVALLLALRFASHSLGPDDTARAIHGSAFYAVATGWLHGLRTVVGTPSVAATLAGLAAHRVAFGINTLLMLVIVRHTERSGSSVWASRPCSCGRRIRLVHRRTLSPRRSCAASGASPPRTWPCSPPRSSRCSARGWSVPVMLVCGFLLGVARAGRQAVRRHRDADRRR